MAITNRVNDTMRIKHIDLIDYLIGFGFTITIHAMTNHDMVIVINDRYDYVLPQIERYMADRGYSKHNYMCEERLNDNRPNDTLLGFYPLVPVNGIF